MMGEKQMLTCKLCGWKYPVFATKDRINREFCSIDCYDRYMHLLPFNQYYQQYKGLKND